MYSLEGRNENREEKPMLNKYLRELMFSGIDEKRRLEMNNKNLDEISSFFDSFDYWELLPTEIKCMIIKEVDFSTRFSLLFCSKSMKQIAETVPYRIQYCEATGDLNSNNDGREYFSFLAQPYSSKRYRVSFDREEDHFSIRRCWGEADRLLFTNETFSPSKYDLESFSFVEDILKLAKYQVDEFCFEIENYGKADIAILDKLQVKKTLIITTSDENVLKRVLDTAKSPLDILLIDFYCEVVTKCIIQHETIENAKDLRFSRVSINDSRLLSLKCEELSIEHYSDITDRGINTYLKRWVNGGGPKNFKTAYFERDRRSHVLNNLEYFEWDDEFKKQNTTLCKWIDQEYQGVKDCYYIESEKRNNGATLIINKYFVVFLVTGKRQSSR